MSDIISPNLKVILNHRFDADESFIRHGPLRRLQNEDDASVSFFPWVERKMSASPTKKSLMAVYTDIKLVIRQYINNAPQQLPYREIGDAIIHYITYWIVHLGGAMPQNKVVEAVKDCLPAATDKQIINALYVLQMVRWIKLDAYGPYRYYYTLFRSDSLVYAFAGGPHDSTRFVADVSRILKGETKAPKAILERAVEARR